MKVGEDALQAACTLQRGRGIVPARQSAEQRHVPLQVQRHRAHAHLVRVRVKVRILLRPFSFAHCGYADSPWMPT